MDEHIKLHPSCTLCMMNFASQDNLTLHRVTKHRDRIPSKLYMTSRHGITTCFICGLKFIDSALADIHTRRDHPILRLIFFD